MYAAIALVLGRKKYIYSSFNLKCMETTFTLIYISVRSVIKVEPANIAFLFIASESRNLNYKLKCLEAVCN